MIDPSKKKLLIIIGVIGALLVLVIIIVAIVTNANKDTNKVDASNPVVTTYTDPYSGETITTTENKAPEGENVENSVVYFGFSKLLQYGMSTDQVFQLKDSIAKYSHMREEAKQDKIKEVTIDYATYRQLMSEEVSQRTVEFTIVMNRDENMRYKFTNTSIYTRDLLTIIYAPNGTIVFDSSKDGDEHEH